jgi:excisionase family DNA binding protein
MSKITARVLTIDEVARVLKISKASAYLAVSRGQLPSLRIGKSLRVPEAALARLLADPRPEQRKTRPARWAQTPAELFEDGAAA